MQENAVFLLVYLIKTFVGTDLAKYDMNYEVERTI